MGTTRVVIVGAASPVVRPVAEGLAAAGVDVAIAAASMDGDEVMAAKRIARAVQQAGRRSLSQAWDVTLPQNIHVSLRQVVKELGAPDGLLYTVGGQLEKPFEKISDAEAAREFELGLMGAFFATRSFLRELPGGGTGRVVFLPDSGRPVAGSAVAKVAAAGLHGLVTALSFERPEVEATVVPVRTVTGEMRSPEDVAAGVLEFFLTGP